MDWKIDKWSSYWRLDKCDTPFIKPKDVKSGKMYGMKTQKESNPARIITSGSGIAD